MSNISVQVACLWEQKGHQDQVYIHIVLVTGTQLSSPVRLWIQCTHSGQYQHPWSSQSNLLKVTDQTYCFTSCNWRRLLKLSVEIYISIKSFNGVHQILTKMPYAISESQCRSGSSLKMPEPEVDPTLCENKWDPNVTNSFDLWSRYME